MIRSFETRPGVIERMRILRCFLCVSFFMLLALNGALPCSADGADSTAGTRGTEVEKRLVRIGGLSVDLIAREIHMECRAGEDAGILEYLLVAQAGKAYESRFVSVAGRPSDLHAALLLLGIEPVPFPRFQEAVALLRGEASVDEVRESLPAESFLSISVVVLREDGTLGPRRSPRVYVEERDGDNEGELNEGVLDSAWVFTGSFFNPSGVYAADATLSYAALWPDPAATINLLSAAGNPYRTAGGYASVGKFASDRFLMIVYPVSERGGSR